MLTRAAVLMLTRAAVLMLTRAAVLMLTRAAVLMLTRAAVLMLTRAAVLMLTRAAVQVFRQLNHIVPALSVHLVEASPALAMIQADSINCSKHSTQPYILSECFLLPQVFMVEQLVLAVSYSTSLVWLMVSTSTGIVTYNMSHEVLWLP